MKVYGALEVAQLEWFLDSAKPAASSYIYRVIYVSDLKQIMVSDGTNWIPYLNTSTNQTINGNITMNGSLTQENGAILKEIATPSTPSSGYGRVYFKSDGKLYQLNDSGIETQVGTGSGGINYIANGGAEDNNTTGWATYANAAGASPVTGTGGTANVTISTTATTPLIGTYSFLMAKDAVNRQGQGWSYAFTIDSAYRAKVLQISFQYLVNTGTFAAGTSTTDSDVTVWIYDVTNGVIIQPSSYKLLSNRTSITDTFNATFQTASNSSSYRLIFHVSTTSASAYTLEVDGISVSPSTYVYGTPVTDWQSYTPTFQGFGTPTNVEMRWRRIGDSVEIYGRFTAGTTTAVEARIGLPSGLTASTTKVSTIQSANGVILFNGGNPATFQTLIESGKNYITIGAQNSTNAGLTKLNASTVSTSGGVLSFYALVAIEGFSSSVQTSDQTDTRIVSFVGSVGSGQSLTANVTNISATSVKDSHAGWGGSSYTVQVAGDYIVSGAISTSVIQTIEVYKNGTLISNSSWSTARSANDSSGGSITVPNCIVGDTLSVRSTVSGTVNKAYICISRITGPSAIAASESVNASYYISAGASTAVNVQFNFDTKVYDSHNAVTTGAGAWKFTAPISGKYQVSSCIYNAAATNNTVTLFKNGSLYRYMGYSVVNSATGLAVPMTTTLFLNAGDYIDVRSGNNTVTPAAGNHSGATVANTNFIDITRIGN
jgi:hypothetical protein